MDETNPVTGGPYRSKQEYEDLRRKSAEEIRQLAAAERLRRAEEARKKAERQGKNDPTLCSQGCGEALESERAPATEGVIKLKCDDGWNDCQKRQARAKVARLNELARKNNGLTRRATAGAVRDVGNSWAAKYRSDFNRIANGEPTSSLEFTHPEATPPKGTSADFMDDCLYQQWIRDGKPDSSSAPLDKASPDHIRDLQWGGHVQGPMVWLDREVNEKLGRDMSSGDNDTIDVAKGFELKCP
ncbi:MAG: hypothetical protein U0Q16_09150 [Bryobacteraceae bacterium]